MLKNDCTVLYEPTALVRASGRVPKTLHFRDTKGDGSDYFIEPIIEGQDLTKAKIFYKLPLKFARTLLSDPRFLLCEPKRVVIQKREIGVGFRNTIMKACGKMPSGEKLNDDEVAELELKRAELEEKEYQGIIDRETPEHLKNAVKKTEELTKKQAKKVEATIQAKEEAEKQKSLNSDAPVVGLTKPKVTTL